MTKMARLGQFVKARMLHLVLLALVLVGGALFFRSCSRQNADVLFGRGSEALYKGDYNRAITDFSKTIDLKPNYALAYYNRSSAYSCKGDYDKAIADLNHILSLDPEMASAYRDRGADYESKGDLDKAFADYNRAIQLDPLNTLTYYYRGLAYYNQKHYDEAIADFNQALHPNSKSAPLSTDSAVHGPTKRDDENVVLYNHGYAEISLFNVHPNYYRGLAYLLISA